MFLNWNYVLIACLAFNLIMALIATNGLVSIAGLVGFFIVSFAWLLSKIAQ